MLEAFARVTATAVGALLLAGCQAGFSPSADEATTPKAQAPLAVVFLAGKFSGGSAGDADVRACLSTELAAASASGELTESDAWALALDSPLASDDAQDTADAARASCS